MRPNYTFEIRLLEQLEFNASQRMELVRNLYVSVPANLRGCEGRRLQRGAPVRELRCC